MWARLAVLLLVPLAPLAQAEACEPCDSYPNGPVPSDATSLCQKLERDEMKCYAVQGDGNCGIGELCAGPPVTQEVEVPDCECTGFVNQAWLSWPSFLCQKKTESETGPRNCMFPNDNGDCPSDHQKCQGPMTHNDFPVCDCPHREGAKSYDAYSCTLGDTCKAEGAVGDCQVCKESAACDTSEECSGDDFYSLCRREKRYGCCEAEEACREKDYIQSKTCVWDCGADTGLESWRWWRLHDDATGCDTSECSDWLCRRETRMGCCVAQMGCAEYGDYGCFSACCEATGWGARQCKDMYYQCEAQVSGCDGDWRCMQAERQKCCLAKEGCDALDDDDDDAQRACHYGCCDEFGIGDTDCRDMYYECDLSGCDGAENEWWCKQELRQTCCTDKKDCLGRSGEAQAECFSSCCEEIGIWDNKCEELYEGFSMGMQ